MKFSTVILTLILLYSCTTVQHPVSTEVQTQATKFPVKGLNGWMINQQLSFGNYYTSKVKRGWDFTYGMQHTKFLLNPEEQILKVFKIDTDKRNINQKNKFQYFIEDGKLVAEVYAMEKFNEKQLVYKSNNPWIGNASKTLKYEYAFSAAILPLTAKDAEPWSLVLINRYDASKDTARRLRDRPYVEEEGYATNGKESFAIRPVSVDQVASKNGEKRKVIGGKILSGYELRKDNKIVGTIDILDNNIWLYNDLKPFDKLIVSSISSAILLKRMQDIQKDKDQLDN